MLGFFKKVISSDEKAEVLETIEAYRSGLVPLVVPVTLIKHHVSASTRLPTSRRQTFLSPNPAELLLRNRV
jgi:uncharacterized protein YbgA (DUF1722 family)